MTQDALWTEQLRREYDHICFTYRLSLRRPLIIVRPLSGRWGEWDSETRTLSISAPLIENHPWSIVLEILKHEMAHQWVTDLYGSDTPHGALFQQACDLLAIAPWARRAETESLPPGDKSLDIDEPMGRLLERVRKLLSLAQSDNEHEALAAMQKVRELYLKHNLSQAEVSADRRWKALTLSTKKKRIERPIYSICSILSEHYFVSVVYCSQYDAKELCEFRAIEIMGAEENVLMAEYVFEFLHSHLERLWKEFRCSHPKHGASRQSYMLGVLTGFRKRLEAEKARVESELDTQAHSLIVAEDQARAAFVRRRFPRIVNVQSGARRHDSAVYSAGLDAGSKLVLNRPFERTSCSASLLLIEK